MKNSGQESKGDQTKPPSVPLRADIRRQVLDQILHGKIAPGAHIIEATLASELNVSRTPLREALSQLEQEGFVTSSRDRGFFAAGMTEREVREIYPILSALESLALRLAGKGVLLSIEELTKINNQLKKTHKPKDSLVLDTRWHETLIAYCPNQRLKDFISYSRLIAWRYELIYMKEEKLIDVSFKQHAAIIEALEAGDTETATVRLEENWRFGMDVLLLRLNGSSKDNEAERSASDHS